MGGCHTKASYHIPRRRYEVIIVEAAELVRRGLRDVFARHTAFHLKADAASFGALPTRPSPRPDLVIFGSHESPGSDALRDLQAHVGVVGGGRAIVLLESDAPQGVVDAVRAGARGVLRNDADAETLLSAAEHVLRGDACLDPALVGGVFDVLSGRAEAPHHPEAGSSVALQALSPREREVLQALARGYRNKEIAAMLGVSVGTVKTHLRHIFRKTRVGDRLGAVLLALNGARVELSGIDGAMEAPDGRGRAAAATPRERAEAW